MRNIIPDGSTSEKTSHITKNVTAVLGLVYISVKYIIQQRFCELMKI